MKVELLNYTPNPETHISNCARTCYDSKQKDIESSRKMIRAIIRSGHESCIEHSSATFRLSEISRVVTHEFVRHRIGFSYSQRSQRYVNEESPSYVIPDELNDNEEARKLFIDSMNEAWKSYAKLQNLGFKNEIARYVLPNACSTEICVTADFRAWRNFLKLRLSKRAQPEIRKLANVILDELIKIAPSCFDDLKNQENIQNT